MNWYRKAFCVISVAFLLLTSPAVAQQVGHLDPEAPAFGKESWHAYYDRVVSDVLKDAFASNVLGNVVIEPSFTSEYAVGIAVDDHRYSIFTLKPSHHLWGYNELHEMEIGGEVVMKDGKEVRDEVGIAKLRSLLPADWHDVKVMRCTAGIDAVLGKSIADAWQLTLLTTRYDPPPEITADKNGNITSPVVIQLDGTAYHFAAGDMAGQDYNPGKESASAQLAGIAFTMDDYCKTRNMEDLNSLSVAANALVKELKDAFAGL